MTRYTIRCPACNQFWKDGHTCPQDNDMPSNTSEGMTWTETDHGALLDVRSKRIRTLDELLDAAQVDLTKWYVERHVINKWEIGARGEDGEIVVEPLIQVKVWLRPISPLGSIKEVISELISDMNKHSKKVSKRPLTTKLGKHDEKFLYEVNIADLHFGMYSWEEEADENYDIKIARDLFLDSVATLVTRVSHLPIEKILFPIGNDLLHVDYPIAGKGGQTTKGTPQDVDTRYKKMFRDARKMIVCAIDYLDQIAPVDILVVPGNHDMERMFCLGDSLEAWYRLDENVEVMNDARARKYYVYGNTLLGFTHGSEEKIASLPQLMASEAPDAWAATNYREWHIGHKHGLKEVVSENVAVRIRVVPSIAPNDEWHTRKGYRHMRSAEAYLYERDAGFTGLFATTI